MALSSSFCSPSHRLIPERELLSPSKNDNCCLALSIKFLADFIRSKRHISPVIDDKIKTMTTLYETSARSLSFQTEEEAKGILVDLRRKMLAKENLFVETLWNLDLEFEKLISFFKEELPIGCYLFCLPGHVTALVKTNEELYFYDPNAGVANMKSLPPSGGWFKELIKNYRGLLADYLQLMKISDHPSEMKIVQRASDDPIITLGPEKRFQDLTFTWRGDTVHYRQDQRTHYIYNGDPISLVRKKCILLTLRTPIDMLVRMIYHIAMTLLNFVLLRWRKLDTSFFDIFRSAIYGIACTFAAIYGSFKPLEGRILYGELEIELNRQQRHVDRKAKYYLAPCFIPINYNATDKENLTDNTICLKRNYKWLKQVIETRHNCLDLIFGFRHTCCKK